MRPFLHAALLCLAASPVVAESVFQWNQGQPPVEMGPSAGSFCILTRVAGAFRGLGEEVRLEDHLGLTWRLTGSSQQDGVSGTARCFPHAAFSGPGPARWHSFRFPDVSGAPGPGGCYTFTSGAWWGDAATAVSGIRGDFRGGGEFVQVVQSADPFRPSSYRNQTCRDGRQMYAEVRSFFVGAPSAGRLATFVGADGARGPVTAIPEFVAGPNQTVALAPRADAMCYFSRIGGAFNGGGESAEIRPDGAHWVLSTASKSGDGVWARARCMAFRQ